MVIKASFLKRILLFSLILLLGNIAQAQRYSFYFPEANNRLPQQFVYALTTDYQGYLWVGTGEGLVKYDGTRVIPVKVGKDNSAAFCTSLLSRDKDIIAGFFDGTVAIGRDEQLQTLSVPADGKIVSITSTGNAVFIASQNTLYRLNQNKLEAILNYNDGRVIHAICSRKDEILMATSEGLISFNPNSKKSKQLLSSALNVVKTEKGYFAINETGIYKVLENSVQQLSLQGGNFNFQPGTPLVAYDRCLFVAIDHHIIEYCETEVANEYAVMNDFTIGSEEIGTRAISVINKQLWLGTYGNGLAFFNPSSYAYYPSTEKRKESSVALAFDGTQLLELSAHTLNFYPLSNGLPSFPASKSLRLSFEGTTMASVGSNILIGSSRGVISTLRNGMVVPLSQYSRHLSGKAILAISGNDKETFISEAFNGVYQLDAKGALINHFSTQNGLLHNDIFKVYRDSKDQLWFLSRSSGISVFKGGEFRYITMREGLSSLEITDIAEDKNGIIWLSSEGGGVSRIEESTIDNFNISSGLSSDYFYGIGASGDNVCAYSRGSINILVGNSLRKIESRELGITPNFSPRSMVIGDAWIAVGSEYGPVVQCLEQVFQANSLKLLVKRVLVNDEKEYSSLSSFDYDDYKMEFRIEKINLNPFFQPEVEFKLEGFDKEWQTLTGQSVIYQSIKDNEYRFVVRDKAFIKNFNSFEFEVDKPIWKKPWYYVLAIALIVLGVYVVFKYRLKQLRDRNKELEQKVDERTIELRKKNGELQQFTFAISHDLKNPAINMVELVRLLKSLPNDAHDVIPEIVGQLDNVSNKMLANLMDLIDLLKYAGTEELPKENVDLRSLITGVQNGIIPSIQAAKGTFDIVLDEFDHVYFNRPNLHSVFQNLISNAMKYKRPDLDSHVEIKSFMYKGSQAISVKDNGLGIDLKINGDRLFGIFQRMHHHVEGSGIGLHLVKSIMEKHGGAILVESEPGEGTRFILIFAQQSH